MLDTDVTEARRPPWKCILGAFLFQAVALTMAGWINRHALNPDAVAYLRIASYYAHGKTDLAVSDYWSPLISWLIVPCLKLGMTPLPAARVAMGFSAVFFLWSCLHIFRRFGLPQRLLCWGVWVSAIVSIPWSVENITPDLLLAGLVNFAFATMVADRWLEKRFAPFACGILWGVAYLCKAIALPVGILVSLGIAALWWRKRPEASGHVLRSLALTVLGMALISAPWIAVISAKAGKITLSTSASLNHSLVGPTVDKPLYLLDQGFHRPDAGRITRWENPSLPYPEWSPFASWRNAARQMQIVFLNIPVVIVMLTSVNLLFPVLMGAALRRWRRRRNIPAHQSKMLWAALPIAALGILYLPNYLLIFEQRYFYPVFALSFVLSAGLLFRGENTARSTWIERYGVLLLALALLLPTFGRVWFRPSSTKTAGECAHVLAQKIRDAHLFGPVAGSGRLPGGRTGLYLAFLLDQPWLGDELAASASSFKHSGADLIVVNRGSKVARELESDANVLNLDSHLFGSEQVAEKFPLRIFKSFVVDHSSTFN